MAGLADLSPDDLAAMQPETYANPFVKRTIGDLATLPRRAIENSQYALDTGHYDPAVPVETALTMMGGAGAVPAEANSLRSGASLIKSGEMAPKPIVRLRIKDIEHGESAMPGGALTEPSAPARVAEYANRPTPFPPIEVMPPDVPGGKYMVYDGSHRLEAAKLRGDTHIDAIDPFAKPGAL